MHVKHALLFKLSSSRKISAFSLIELVVVIAILGVLISVALPSFLNIQKDGQAAQAKNALATIVKECVVSSLRGKSLKFSQLSSAQASLSGYTLTYAGHSQQTQQFQDSDCIGPLPSGGEGTLLYANPTRYVAGQTYTELPQFQIVYRTDTGQTDRVCQYYYGVSGVYPAGCDVSGPPNCTLPPPGQVCPPPGQGWVTGKW
jgi:prepilin-type N-terminal cleavage/methylation domain-containing protein